MLTTVHRSFTHGILQSPSYSGKVGTISFILQKEKLMLRQTKSLPQGHAADEVMDLGFKPRPRRRGWRRAGTLLSYSAILPKV